MWHIENLKYLMTEEYSKPCQISKLMRDILRTITYSEQLIEGNLRVRISDPWEKRVPRKIFFGLETSKIDHFYSQNCPFIFQKCPFVSWNLPCFPEVPLFFLKNALLFFRIAIEMPPFYLLCAPFSKSDLIFSSWVYLLILLRAA